MCTSKKAIFSTAYQKERKYVLPRAIRCMRGDFVENSFSFPEQFQVSSFSGKIFSKYSPTHASWLMREGNVVIFLKIKKKYANSFE